MTEWLVNYFISFEEEGICGGCCQSPVSYSEVGHSLLNHIAIRTLGGGGVRANAGG